MQLFKGKCKLCFFSHFEPRKWWKVAWEPSCVKFTFPFLFTVASQAFVVTSASGLTEGSRRYACEFWTRWGGEKHFFNQKSHFMAIICWKKIATVHPVTVWRLSGFSVHPFIIGKCQQSTSDKPPREWSRSHWFIEAWWICSTEWIFFSDKQVGRLSFVNNLKSKKMILSLPQMFYLHLSFLLLTSQKTIHKFYTDLELVLLCTYKIYIIYVS